MFSDRIETKWIEAFKNQFTLCGIQPGDTVAILSETQSRQINVHLSELALGLLGTRTFHIVVPTQRQTAPVRSAQLARLKLLVNSNRSSRHLPLQRWSLT